MTKILNALKTVHNSTEFSVVLIKQMQPSRLLFKKHEKGNSLSKNEKSKYYIFIK